MVNTAEESGPLVLSAVERRLLYTEWVTSKEQRQSQNSFVPALYVMFYTTVSRLCPGLMSDVKHTHMWMLLPVTLLISHVPYRSVWQ